MSRVIVFAGTTEGRILSEWLAGSKVETLCSVATEYGETLISKKPGLAVRRGRLTAGEMEELFIAEGRPLVLDATHPYAEAVSENIFTACRNTGSEYLRIIRPGTEHSGYGDVIFVNSVDEAVEYLCVHDGNVLVTTGSKELYKYTAIPDFRKRVYARVLSTPEAASACAALGFAGRHLICMQGPFSREMNTAMLREFHADYLVTKESGKAGGFREKAEAAADAGAALVIVGRPPEREGVTVEEGIRLLQERFGIEKAPSDTALCMASGDEPGAFGDADATRRAYLVGIGMGVPENMTAEALEVFESADCIMGSGRMLDPFAKSGKPLFDDYDPVRMASFVREHPEYRSIAVSLSGDVGFYSGAKRLISAFEAEGLEVKLISGISSLVYFCGRLRIPWEDVYTVSVHGRKGNVVAAAREHFRTFALLGGKDGAKLLLKSLVRYGLCGVTVYVGERLHYPEERIVSGSPEELLSESFDGLCVAIIENPYFYGGVRTGIPDDEFVRGKAPMTKSEVRCVSIAKLCLKRDSVVWDVGSGTGSVAVEAAIQAPEGMVYAVEKKEEAADLIEENAVRFAVSNIRAVRGSAPEALEELPAPTHVFIGGSSGNLREILKTALERNPTVRVVINAITLETVAESNQCLKELDFSEIETVQLQVSRAKSVGPYAMMTGQNPVYIFSARGCGGLET